MDNDAERNLAYRSKLQGKIHLLDYLIGIAGDEGEPLWRALFAEIRQNTVNALDENKPPQ